MNLPAERCGVGVKLIMLATCERPLGGRIAVAATKIILGPAINYSFAFIAPQIHAMHWPPNCHITVLRLYLLVLEAK